MVADSLIISSEVIGFISFAITLLTVIGVYRDLLSTLRSADTHIPLILGNLRQEILFERAFIANRLRCGDEFRVFGGRLKTVKGLDGQKDKARRAFALLLQASIRDLWMEFKVLERPFLISKAQRAEEVRRGGYWGESDLEVNEKRGSRRKKKKGSGGGGFEDQNFYRTDLSHRWIWWQSKGDVDRLAQQVQRVQIRRMERDLFETDELVKRLIRRGGGMDGESAGTGSGSSSGSDGGGGGRRNVAGVGIVRSRAVSKANSVREPVSRRGSMRGRNVREVEEREIVRRSAPSPSALRQSELEASNTGRRRDRRAESRVEYEVLRPGNIYVDVPERPRSTYGYGEDRRGVERRRSYSRERGRQ